MSKEKSRKSKEMPGKDDFNKAGNKKIELHEEKCKKYQELQRSEDNKRAKILGRKEKI